MASTTGGAADDEAGRGLQRKWRLAACTLGGAALGLAFPEPDIAPLAWIAIAPLLYATRRTPPRRSFLYGTVFGLAFFGILLSWVSIVGWVAWAILIVLESLFLGATAWCWARISMFDHLVVRVAGAATAWVAFEYLRTRVPLGGFTWGQLAQSQHDLGWMLRPAGIAGAWAVAAIIVAVNALIVEAVQMRPALRPAAASLVAAGALVAAPVLIPAPSATGSRIRVSIVQGNVPRDFDGPVIDKELHIIASHERLTRSLERGSVDLVVWPESSVGIDIGESEAASSAVRNAARSVGVPMIVGGNLDAGAQHYKVMAFLVSPRGGIVDRYQKTHLVPFGEYVPGRAFLDWIPMLDQVPRDALAAEEETIFDVAGGAVAPVISYEGDFGSLVRRRIDRGGRLLVVATNTSTWGESWASAQHVAFSQVRSAENGVWTVHAALSGISAFVAPDGSLQASTPLWKATTLEHDVAFASQPTFYARTGDWLAWGSALTAGALDLVALLRVRRT